MVGESWKNPIGAGIGNILFSVIANIFGITPMFYHINSVLWHLAATILVYFFVFLLTQKKPWAFLTAVFFAIHPLQSEAVAFISAVPYPIYTSFLLLTFITVILIDRNILSRRWMACAVLTTALTFLGSEKGIILPILLIFYFLLFSKPRKIILLWPILLLTCFYALIPLSRLGDRIYSVNPQNAEFHHTNQLITLPLSIATYLGLFFWPVGLTLYHDVFSITTIRYVLLVLEVLVFFSVSCVFYRKNRLLFFFAGFFFISLWPVILPLHISWVVGERYTYLGNIGLLAIVSFFLLKFRAKNKTIFNLVALALVLISVTLTVRRTFDWANEDRLWQATLSASPNSPKAMVNVAAIYLRKGDGGKAFDLLDQAARIDPNNAEAMHDLGLLYLIRGDTKKSQELVEKANRISPSSSDSILLLAKIHIVKGEFSQADKYIEKAKKLKPTGGSLERVEVDYFLATGETAKARELIAELLRRKQGDANVEELAKRLGVNP